MPQRIYEQYAPCDRVEIILANRGEKEWRPAVVLRREPPGIWVQADGYDWFMTNTYRIRPAGDDPNDEPATPH